MRAMVAAAKTPPQRPVPPIRGWLERAIQTVSYELGGLLVVGPVWKLVTGASTTESIVLLACLSVAVMTWMAVYNTVFDFAESRIARRVASDRPHRWRVVHAVGLEATSIVVTWPLIVLLAGLDWYYALAADIGLTLAYAAYGYCFHLGFDRLRPVARCPDTDFPGVGVNRPAQTVSTAG